MCCRENVWIFFQSTSFKFIPHSVLFGFIDFALTIIFIYFSLRKDSKSIQSIQKRVHLK